MIYLIGERFADLRKDKKLSQKELAEKLKISAYTVSSYEREKSTPDDEMKVKIAEFFNISLDLSIGAYKRRNTNRRQQAYCHTQKSAGSGG